MGEFLWVGINARKRFSPTAVFCFDDRHVVCVVGFSESSLQIQMRIKWRLGEGLYRLIGVPLSMCVWNIFEFSKYMFPTVTATLRRIVSQPAQWISAKRRIHWGGYDAIKHYRSCDFSESESCLGQSSGFWMALLNYTKYTKIVDNRSFVESESQLQISAAMWNTRGVEVINQLLCSWIIEYFPKFNQT